MIMVLKEVSFVVAAPKLTQGEHKFLSTCYVLVKASLLLCVKKNNTFIIYQFTHWQQLLRYMVYRKHAHSYRDGKTIDETASG